MDKQLDFEESGTYKYLVKKFTAEKIKSRCEWIYNLMNDFIEAMNYENMVSVSEDVLRHVIVDYFVDIDRLKEFQEIEKVHLSKIYSYLAYWILRHKPMQILKERDVEELVFVNERFVAYMIRSYLFNNPANVPILDNQKEDVDNFIDTMLYYFQYRDYSAKNIEIMLLAFQAGRGYQYSVDHQ